MKALTIIQTKTGFLVTETTTIPAVDLAECQCFEELGGRYSHGGVIDAVRDYFTAPKVEEPKLREVA